MIKDKIKKLFYGKKYNSQTYVNNLRKLGMRIGERVTIYVPSKTTIDETRPWMIEIGDDVQITEGVTILTHGYDWSVLKGLYGDVLGSCGKVKIGNNVFIGMHATILKGTTIGNNCIIGASSFLKGGCFPDNSVIVGNPAKVVGTVEDYYAKRKAAQLKEAKECAIEYNMTYKKFPPKEIFYEFFWLFEKRNDEIIERFDEMMGLVGNKELSYQKFKEEVPIFDGYDKFLEYCFEGEEM